MADITTVPAQSEGDLSFRTDSDLSSYQYHYVKLDSNEKVVAGDANCKTLGILQNAPDGSSNEAIAVVRVWGVSKLKADENWAHGNFLTCTSTAKGEVCDAANEEYGAIAIGSADDGDLGAVLIARGEVTASDA